MSKARDLADSAQEINILDGKSFLDEDNFASDSATGIASQQSIKAYVDGITTTNITSTGALNSGSITSGFGNIDNGSSTITTTGAITGGSFVIGSADINENDLESIDGITAGTVSASKAVVVNTNKDITGFRNITATGTISGSLSGTLSGSLSSTTTATTQAESDDSTKIATTAYVTDKITTLIGGAPSTLNDLNELAAAINDDANYNSTLTTALGTKLAKAGGTMTGDIAYLDNVKAKFGAGDDLQIFHDGSNSFINEGGAGDLTIKASNNLYLMSGSSEVYAKFTTDGAATLYHNNSAKLATTSTGIQVTGNVAVSGTVDGVDIAAFKTSFDNLSTDIVSDTTPQLGGALDVNGHSISFGDNEKARFGNADDLQIYHNGGDSIIADTGNGDLYIRGSNDIRLQSATGSDTYAHFQESGFVKLYHNNSEKLATTASGVNITGNVTVTGTLDGRDLAADGVRLDTMATNANNYSHPTGNGNNHIPSGGSTDQILKYASAGTAQWSDPDGGASVVTVTSGNNAAYNDDKGAEEKYNAGQYLLEYTATSNCLVFAISGTLKYRYWTASGGYFGYSYRVYVNGNVVNSQNPFYSGNPNPTSGSIPNPFGSWSSAYLSSGQKIRVTAGEHETQNQGYLQWYDSSMQLAIIPL